MSRTRRNAAVRKRGPDWGTGTQRQFENSNRRWWKRQGLPSVAKEIHGLPSVPVKNRR